MPAGPRAARCSLALCTPTRTKRASRIARSRSIAVAAACMSHVPCPMSHAQWHSNCCAGRAKGVCMAKQSDERSQPDHGNRGERDRTGDRGRGDEDIRGGSDETVRGTADEKDDEFEETEETEEM